MDVYIPHTYKYPDLTACRVSPIDLARKCKIVTNKNFLRKPAYLSNNADIEARNRTVNEVKKTSSSMTGPSPLSADGVLIITSFKEKAEIFAKTFSALYPT